MDTRWGLDLDMSAVRLMRRDGDNWVEDAVEPIDSPDIEERLERLIEPVGPGGTVMLFLPRDQILYTQVELDASADTRTQIERAMEGRTPYGLDELSFDWDVGGDDLVRVAAIARDTLDEAAAFAEVRGLGIAGYSTLFSGDDYPRLPNFDGPKLKAKPLTLEPAVPFATARVPSRPPGDVAAASVAATAKARFTPTPTEAEVSKREPSRPVVEVADTTPVVQVKAPQVPLDPGIPIAAPNAPPRVRTDIAAASVSGHAASLTPPGGSVRLRKKGAPISTLAVMAVAFLLTIGIAVMVWNYLPMRPGQSTTVEAPVDTGALSSDVAEDPGPIAPAEPEEPEITFATLLGTEAAAIEGVLSALPAAPLADEDPRLASLPTGADVTRPALAALATPTQGLVPNVDRTTPELQLPKMTATIQIAPPFLGPDPDIDETTDTIYTSAFEIPKPASDAIALPDIRGLSQGSVPGLPGPLPTYASLQPTPELEAEPSDVTTDTQGVIPETADLSPAPETPSAEADTGEGEVETAAFEAETEVTPEPQSTPELATNPVATAVEQALADALVGPGGLIPTDFARALPDTRPGARPSGFTETLERRENGGRTRAELELLRPPPRPASAQALAEATAEASELAVANASAPRNRPDNMEALVTAARVQAEAARVTASAAIRTPDTSGAIEAALEEDTEPQNRAVRPRALAIPTTASVARRATIEDAIRLNRINLVGVYGAPSDRRALLRLSSGRYVKVKVGDRVDGGTVAQITDSELYYRKGNRTLSLAVPQG